eukprot:CAMPEP_0172569536 /NCGR_PEP_ID=MMETSP1067-20121228/123899_1 /TAXON_ID=265564 ORGANISM="Thalassiosira punctigera, Strain Tpunct2005C2" /NCGR_SAMPLE_ID=MMETSP1067 /ASSEMBLY_ACC=CAM_ASM_000444 /LENGTH=182 /DNA_ID=CAMNT_0013361387 /DNA_START=27 /DNA_END=576 /DNA_ORIENTATION=-
MASRKQRGGGSHQKRQPSEDEEPVVYDGGGVLQKRSGTGRIQRDLAASTKIQLGDRSDTAPVRGGERGTRRCRLSRPSGYLFGRQLTPANPWQIRNWLGDRLVLPHEVKVSAPGRHIGHLVGEYSAWLRGMIHNQLGDKCETRTIHVALLLVWRVEDAAGQKGEGGAEASEAAIYQCLFPMY